MALIKCPGCGHDVSTLAEVCPNCGYRIKKMSPIKEQHCVNCGGLLTENAQFCKTCGAKTNNNSVKKVNKSKIIGIVVTAAIAVVIIMAGNYIVKKIGNGKYLARVCNKEGNYGYINADGKEAIPCQYQEASDFNENGFAIVYSADNGMLKAGIIDKSGDKVAEYGNVRIEYYYGNESDISEKGLVIAAKEKSEEDSDYLYGAFNLKGEQIIPFQYDRMYEFSDNGLALVGKDIEIDGEYSGTQYGFINEEGEEVIPCQYSDATSFSENGLAAVGFTNDEESRYVFINASGEQVFTEEYAYAQEFRNNGLALVAKYTDVIDDEGRIDMRYGFINEKGDEVISCQYDWADSFTQCGIANVGIYTDLDSKSYRINENGEALPEIDYYSVDYYSSENGLTAVERFNTDKMRDTYDWGYIDEKLNEVISCQYGSVGYFADNGLAAVQEQISMSDSYANQLWGFINEKGNLVIPFQFSVVAGGFAENNLAAVAVDTDELASDGGALKRWFYIDKKGNEVLDFGDTYHTIGMFIKVK